jgi:hypothetical protein
MFDTAPPSCQWISFTLAIIEDLLSLTQKVTIQGCLQIFMNIKVLFELIIKEAFLQLYLFAAPMFCAIIIHPKREIVELIVMTTQNRVTERPRT